HNRDVLSDVKENAQKQLMFGAMALLRSNLHEMPETWDKGIVYKMIQKSYKERLIIAGALLCAEIDRLNAIGE
ncbi:MAG TPA: hypothetical protein VN026_08390, partial [Bacteroidia bacterium]|nr:hypothetical protein [Bacteroidia bacterium]